MKDWKDQLKGIKVPPATKRQVRHQVKKRKLDKKIRDYYNANDPILFKDIMNIIKNHKL